MLRTQQYFALLAMLAFTTMIRYVFVNLGLQKAAPVLRGEQCFNQPGATSYSFLPQGWNQLNCLLNVFFQAGRTSTDGRLVIGDFGAMFTASTFVLLYESFRPNSGLGAKLAIPYLAVGQVVTSATAIPMYLACSNAAEPARGTPNKPAGYYAWTALIAASLGLIVPSLNLEISNWSFEALSVWQPFPLYIMALCLVLPPLLKPLVSKRTNVPIWIMAAIGVEVSLHGRIALLWGKTDSLRDVFLLDNRPAVPDLADVSRLLFTLDYAFGALAMGSQVAFHSKLGFFTAAGIMIAATLTVGPGAGIAGLWAYNELTDKSDADDVVSGNKVKAGKTD